MNLYEFEKLLQAHDWTYTYSDDHRVWKKGVAEETQINLARNLLADQGVDKVTLDELYSKYKPKFDF